MYHGLSGRLNDLHIARIKTFHENDIVSILDEITRHGGRFQNGVYISSGGVNIWY